MPVQVQQGSLAAKIGGRLAQINAQLAGQPLNLGRQRLPGGIKGGIARLQSMMWKVQDRDDGKVPKGETFFTGAAVVVSPVEFGGRKIAGEQTFFQIPLCDVPAKGPRKATDLLSNFDKFRSLCEALGTAPCRIDPKDDPTGVKVEMYWKAAMVALCDPKRPGGPVYVAFHTRDWTPDKPVGWKEGDRVPETMTIEEWTGKAEFTPTRAGVNVISNGAAQPTPHDSAPVMGPDGLPNNPPSTRAGAAQPTQQGIHSMSPDAEPDLDAEVTALVATCMGDPSLDTEDGQLAAKRLIDLAQANGWTEEQTDQADWEEVGNMAMSAPSAEAAPAHSVGDKVVYARRDKSGARLKDSAGKEYAAQEFHIASIDEGGGSCTLKYAKDGKDLLDVRTRKPSVVKLEWLE